MTCQDKNSSMTTVIEYQFKAYSNQENNSVRQVIKFDALSDTELYI